MGACSASQGAPYICVSPPGFLLGELQACALPVPARKPVRAEVGGVGGRSPGRDMGGPQLAAHPLLALGQPGNSGSLRQARTHEGLFALWWPTWESHPAVPRQVESDPRSPGGSPSRNPGSSRGQAGSPVSSAEASGPWLCDLRPSLGTPRVSAVPTNPSPTPCHPQSSLPPPLCPLQGWCAGGMTGWTHSEPGQSLRCKVGVGLCPLPPWPPP